MFASGENTNHFDATIVADLPAGWSVEANPRFALPGSAPTPTTPVAPRLGSGLGPDVVFAKGARTVVVAVCESTAVPGLREQPALDDPSGDQAAQETAARYYLGPVGSLDRPRPPRLAPHVYRAAHLVAVGFAGGGCLLFGDPAAPDPTIADAAGDTSPQGVQRALRAARRRPLAPYLVAIAKRTTAYWGNSARLPASNLRAEAIARRAQRAVMSAPALRYEEHIGDCSGLMDCRAVEGAQTRVVGRERAPRYLFADVTDQSSGTRGLLVRTSGGVWRSGDGRCWTPDSYRGSGTGVFLFRGFFSHDDDQAAFFPPLRRWQLAYERPGRAGPRRTLLRWHSYFDRGTAIVDNATLRLVRMERVIHASTRAWLRRTASFSYPSALHRIQPRPECHGDPP